MSKIVLFATVYAMEKGHLGFYSAIQKVFDQLPVSVLEELRIDSTQPLLIHSTEPNSIPLAVTYTDQSKQGFSLTKINLLPELKAKYGCMDKNELAHCVDCV